MRNSIHDTVSKEIEQLKKGSLIFPGDFKGLGSEAAINMTLSRLAKAKEITRLAQGIYMVPKIDPQLGPLYPPLDEIAQAVARRDRARISPTGSYALHKLGLSTQIPLKIVYLTDGAPRKIRVGNGDILFKAAAPKKLMLKGEISRLAIPALEELGKGAVTKEILDRINELFRKESPAHLKHDLVLAPNWIRAIFLHDKIGGSHD